MSVKIKRTNDELKADRPTLEEVQNIPKLPISILVENVRSVHNVGSIFRSADGFGANMIYLTGYTAYPPRQDLAKTALGAENAVPFTCQAYASRPASCFSILTKDAYEYVAGLMIMNESSLTELNGIPCYEKC